ncbi:MAG: regulatory protein GemA, partial [Pseudomonadota bacterium]
MGKTAVYDRYRREELAKIHIGKKELNLSDEIYRDILFHAGGVESSADLDWQGRRAVLERYRELGWQSKPAKKAGVRAARRLADDPQSKMLRALWIQLHQSGKVKDPSEAALCSFVKRMTRKDALQWLSDRDVTVVKKALKDWLER